MDKNAGKSKEPSCAGGKITFNYAPADLDKVEYIVPLGQMMAEHVTPVDHQYFYGPDEDTEINLYAPADGTITFVQHMTQPVSDPGVDRKVDDYYLLIEHTCTLSSAFIHVDQPVEEIVKRAGKADYNYINLPVKAGELIGTYHGSVDYNVFDKEANVKFTVPESYKSSRYLEVQDPFDYFSDEIQMKMQQKSLRSVKPWGGKINYDLNGKLIGNWFEKGTNKFSGMKLERYWAGHLSFAYNHIDPSLIMVSIGTFTQDKAQQFAVRDNAPDPATIGVGSGIVKYELVDYEYYYGNGPWDRKTLKKPLIAKPGPESRGVLLAEMLGEKEVKVEIFPGKSVAEVSGFTGNEKVYER